MHEISNSITFLNFKTSLVIAPPPVSVIMTQCVRKSRCDLPLNRSLTPLIKFRNNFHSLCYCIVPSFACVLINNHDAMYGLCNNYGGRLWKLLLNLMSFLRNFKSLYLFYPTDVFARFKWNSPFPHTCSNSPFMRLYSSFKNPNL